MQMTNSNLRVQVNIGYEVIFNMDEFVALCACVEFVENEHPEAWKNLYDIHPPMLSMRAKLTRLVNLGVVT